MNKKKVSCDRNTGTVARVKREAEAFIEGRADAGAYKALWRRLTTLGGWAVSPSVEPLLSDLTYKGRPLVLRSKKSVLVVPEWRSGRGEGSAWLSDRYNDLIDVYIGYRLSVVDGIWVPHAWGVLHDVRPEVVFDCDDTGVAYFGVKRREVYCG